jgi:GAF domain-containing protein
MSARPFHELFRVLERRGITEPDLDRLVAVCAELGDADGASLCLCTPAGRIATFRASHPDVSAAVELQWACGQGPGLEAARHGKPVAVDDLAVAGRWPQLAPALLDRGLRAVVGLPLEVEQLRLGALSLYFRSAKPAAVGELDQGVDLARAAAHVLMLWHAAHPDTLDVLGPHAVVFQAAGIVAGHVGCPADEGLDRLRARAYAEERDLTGLARDVVAGSIRFEA